MDDLVEQLEKALEQSEQREAQLNDRVSALEDILYLTEANLEAAEQRGYANAMEAERKLHEDRIEALEAKHTELVSAVNDLLHDVKYSILDEELSDEEGYELWEDVKKFRRVICAAGLAELKGQNDE